MAVRKPIVLINGILSELPPTDTLGENMVYTKRVDFVGDIIYRAEAVPGSLESDAVWRMYKIELSSIDGDVVETYADGNSEFDNVWTNRLTATYS